MYYIWTLNSHELFGPFRTATGCSAFAVAMGLASYTICPGYLVYPYMMESIRNPKKEWRKL